MKMSGNGDDNKEVHKAVPLDLARTQLTTVRTVDGKTPLLMTSQTLRGMRVLTQGTTGTSVQTSTNTPAIISTNIVPHTVFKQDTTRTQIASILTTQAQPQGTTSITIQRPTQITLTTTPVVAQNVQNVQVGATYHVPRGPAVVANIAAPRSNVTSVRAPMVVTAQSTNQAHTFVRPARTPSPAQGTAWLTTNTTNGSQLKSATTVLSTPVRGATVTGVTTKPQLVTRQQPQQQQQQNNIQNVSTIRPGTTILHSGITIGHNFKTGQNTTSIPALGNTVTIAQVLPSRTQAVVYSANTSGQFTTTPRLTVTSSSQQQTKQNTTTRPVAQVTTARLTIPVNVTQAGTRLVTPQATVLASGAKLSTVPSQQQQQSQSQTNNNSNNSVNNKILTTQPSVTIGRLSVATTPTVTNANLLGQTRTLNIHSLVAVANSSQQRNTHTQPTKVITQSGQGAIHFTPIPATIKTTQTVVTAANRTINVPTAIVNQRQSTVVSSQTIPIASVYSQQADNQQGTTPTANVFIHTPLPSVPRRTSPSPITSTCQTTSSSSTTNVTTYSLASGTYFYDATGNYSVARSFGQHPTSFAALSQSTQQIRPTNLNTQQVHGIVTNQQMRFNPVMVVDQNRQQFTTTTTTTTSSTTGTNDLNLEHSLPTKMTSSPRPSILRKRDHDGSPLKAAKNLTPILTSLPPQPAPSISPPSRPDSRGNGHSSGGSTTISATSSPGLTEDNENSMPHVPLNNKDEENTKPPMEMSPRKKPRKQQLTGNDIDEHNDDMQFIESSLKKEADDSDGNQSDEPRDGLPETGPITTVRKPATASLLNSYRQTWKSTHNHYLRYSDVRPKDERRPTIMDLANQYRIQDKVNGWKIYHLSTQMEDLADQEHTVYDQLTELLKCTESQDCLDFEKDINRINELIKGNLQRIKIINDGMIEAKTQIMKIFDHKTHVTDIINRCTSKRNFKKRDKS